MQPGTKPKPTTLRLLEGEPHKERINQNEPQFRVEKLDCPKYIHSDPIALEEWNRIVPELYNLGLLTVADKTSIELYCTQYSVYRNAIEKVHERGLVTKNTRGGEKALPYLAIAREAAKIIKSIAVEFGLTPSSRGRISIPGQKDEDDPLEKMLKSKGL